MAIAVRAQLDGFRLSAMKNLAATGVGCNQLPIARP